MPNSSSFWVMMSLSSTEKEMDSPCVPSRRVVSKVEIFIEFTLIKDFEEPHRSKPRGYPGRGSDDLRYRYADFLLLLKERHHFAQALADGFDLVVLSGRAH